MDLAIGQYKIVRLSKFVPGTFLNTMLFTNNPSRNSGHSLNCKELDPPKFDGLSVGFLYFTWDPKFVTALFQAMTDRAELPTNRPSEGRFERPGPPTEMRIIDSRGSSSFSENRKPNYELTF